MNKNVLLKSVTLALASAILVACGGISSDPAAPTTNPSTPEPAPTPTLPDASSAIPQGIWQSAVGAATTTSALVMQDGQVWSVLTSTSTTPSTTRLLKASLAARGAGFNGTGKAYVLGTTVASATPAEAVTLSATSVSKTSLNGSITGTTTQAESFSLAYQSRYDTPVTLASFVGSAWSGTLGNGTVNWRIDSAGNITGTRTTGCTYSGQLSLRTEAKAVADVVLTESCPALTQMSGVALKTPDNTGITLMLTTTGDAAGVLIGLK